MRHVFFLSSSAAPRWHLALAVLTVACSGCGFLGSAANVTPSTEKVAAKQFAKARGKVSLGPVLTTSDGGQVYEFDVNQHGNDGLLASVATSDISVQTFDATTGMITKTFAVRRGRGVSKGNDYFVDGIFKGDVGLVDFQKASNPGQTVAKDRYSLVNPVTAQSFTGRWTPPVHLFNVLEGAENQNTSTSVLFGYQREDDTTQLIVSDVGKNTFGKVIVVNQSEFGYLDLPQLAQDTVHDRAVLAASFNYGESGGGPPKIATISLRSGKTTEFSGVACQGSGGCGYVNGLSYDSQTGIACTTTELDGGIEFYDIAKQTGFHELLPNGGGEYAAGSYVANDPVHQFFLVAQPVSSTSSSGSSIQVYDESGDLVESINGLNFRFAFSTVIPVKIAITPSTRTGWVNGPSSSQLQEFTY